MSQSTFAMQIVVDRWQSGQQQQHELINKPQLGLPQALEGTN